ncbi:MAG: hypothetical protein IJO79_06895, partial [Firmicutes bacterium]|nr:hypothetical protein [Bacillota bacterium]
FCYFAEQPMDYLILEVGLGGIGDSTNVVPAPLLSVITSVALDHTKVLGRRLEWIAEEKAGIIKHGCPVLVNIKDKKSKDTVKKIAKKQAAEFFDAASWSFDNVNKSIDGYSFDYKRPKAFGGDTLRVDLSMVGMHQAENALTAFAALDILQQKEAVALEESKVLAGMKAAVQPGRFEVLRKDPYVILDGAHNPNGAAALEETLADVLPHKKVLVVTGILEDKDGMGMVECFSRMSNYVVTTEPDNPRALPSVALANLYRRNFRECEDIPDWKAACRYAQDNMDYFDAILFAGSLYLIGDIRGAWDHDTGKGFIGL